MKLYVLGAGGPPPSKSRYGASFVLQIGEDYLLFDCGPATTYKMAHLGILPTWINWLFFTHHHFDHNADYPCFILTRWDSGNGTEGRLQVFGPPPTRLITERLIGEQGAFVDDWKARIGHPASQHKHQSRGGTLPRPKPSVNAADIEGGEVTKNPCWSVTARRVHHVDPWLKSLAFRLDSGEGSFMYAGDAGPCPEIPDLARGVDTLLIGAAYHQHMDVNPLVADVSTGSLGKTIKTR